MSWSDSGKNQRSENAIKNMSWSDGGKNWLESTKKLNPFGRNWFESTKYMDLAKVSDDQRDLLIKGDGAALLSPAIGSSEGCGSTVKFILTSAVSDDDGSKMAQNKYEKGKIWVEEEIGTRGSISAENLDLLIKGGVAALLSPASGCSEGSGSAVKFILTSAASDDDGCTMAKNKLEKGQISVEEEIGTKGSISAETLDLLIKAGGIVLLGYYGGVASACGFILKCAPSPGDCLEMVENRFENTKSWTEMAKNWYGTSKSWAEEKIRATGISDEHRDLAVKGVGALIAVAAAAGCYGKLGGACRFIFRGGDGSDDREKLMKAPGRPGEFIARAAFEANPKAYFRGLRGKLP